MKESFGNAFVFGAVVLVSFLIVFILNAAINYSRANKVKNRILNYVAFYAELHFDIDSAGNILPIDITSADLQEKIDAELSKIGYRMNFGGWSQNNCPEKGNAELLNPQSNYHYCVYAHPSERGYYYSVTTFMYFDIPIIGTTLELPVSGQTRVIYNLTGIEESGLPDGV